MSTLWLGIGAFIFMLTGATFAGIAAWAFLPEAITIATMTGLLTGAAVYGWALITRSNSIEDDWNNLAYTDDENRKKFSEEIDVEILERENKVRAEAALVGVELTDEDTRSIAGMIHFTREIEGEVANQIAEALESRKKI